MFRAYLRDRGSSRGPRARRAVAAEVAGREARDVTGGEHVGAAIDTAVVVDGDPVVRGEARCGGKVVARHDAEAGDDGVCFEGAAAPP